MTAKRALVVDDSKSARTFLTTLLEQHALEVDAAETAEQAIDYLTRHRPDVIFMDHLMPGMDGFQAVQAIKSNPRTATIPILMYTSQEGELYVGQARALGAMGVLPKQLSPADVSKVLQQLHLFDTEQLDFEIPVAAALATGSHAVTPGAMTQGAPQGAPAAAGVTPPAAELLLRDQIAELRRFMVASLDQQGERILEDVRGLLRDAVPPPAEPPAPPPRKPWLPWVLALAAGVATLALAALLWQTSRQRDELRVQLAQLSHTIAVAPTSVAAPAAASPGADVPGAIPAVSVVRVPFGEMPLSGTRITELRKLVQLIAQQGLRGTVEVRRHAGRFCLSGNGPDGYSLAETGVPYIKCDLVADATDPVLGPGPGESMEFAATLADIRRQYGNAIRVEVTLGTETELQQPYPDIGGVPPRVPTAGQWNAAAEANNRVELRWHAST
jgi:CheY-like chemotaxis protein